MSNSLTVSIQKFEVLGDVIDKTVGTAGELLANLNGPNFHLSSQRRTEMENLARIKAVKQLGSKAQDMARAAGCSLGKLIFLSDRPPRGESGGEYGGNHHKMARSMPMMAMADAEMSGPATPIHEGSGQEVRDTFYGIYELA